MISILVALALTQTGTAPYVRSKVSPQGPTDRPLYWTENTTITWSAEQTGNPETTGDTEFTAFEKAFATWNAVLTSCASLKFNEGPKTASRTVGFDGMAGAKNENILLFRFKNCTAPDSDPCKMADDCGSVYDCWDHQAGAIAITTTTYDPQSGRILDADVELNSPAFVFTTVDPPTPACVKPDLNQSCIAADVQNTVTHEIGHMLGLAHTTYPGSTMNPTAPTGETSKRTLDPGTANFPCSVYPSGKPSNDCLVTDPNGNTSIDCVLLATPKPDPLGAAKTGCQAAEGLLVLPALLALLRRRRR